MKDKAKILNEIAEHLVGAAEGLKKLTEILPSEVDPVHYAGIMEDAKNVC